MIQPRPKLNQLNIVSADPDASIAFYRRLGVVIPEDGVWRTQTGIHHVTAEDASDTDVTLDIDSATFAAIWNRGWAGRPDLPGRIVLGFSVPTREAVNEIYSDLTSAGYSGLQPPYDAFWGSRYAVVEDPDGIAVGLMSPSSPEFRSQPPDM